MSIFLHCRVIQNKTSETIVAWPRKTAKTTPALEKWLGRKSFCIEVDNHFTDGRVMGMEERASGSQVPRIVLPLPDKGIEVIVDFRLDGVIELLKNGTIENGIIKTPLHIKFLGSSYRVLPLLD